MTLSPQYRTFYLEDKYDDITSLSAPGRDRRDLFHRAQSHAVVIGTLLDDIESDDIKGKSSGLVTRRGLPRAASEAQVGILQTKARIMREYHELTHRRGRKSAPELNVKNEKISSRNMPYSELLRELEEMMNRS